MFMWGVCVRNLYISYRAVRCEKTLYLVGRWAVAASW